MLAACKKDTRTAPAFEVSVDKKSYAVGEAVTFNFKGNPDQLTFFSGEPGLRYQYIARTQADGAPNLKFTSARANGTQAASLQVLVSSDFAGVSTDSLTTIANYAKASWTDVTARATLSTGAAVSSGLIDLSDFAAAGKPVFLAFKYLATPGTIQNKWTITALTVTNVLPDASSYLLANLSAAQVTNYGVAATVSPGWVSYSASTGFKWVVTAGSSLVITGATTAVAATGSAESVVFSGPIDLRHVTHDIGTPVKEISARLDNYSYAYKAAGTYNVTWVAANNDIYGTREVVRQLQVIVTP
jgi:hypothetical protein